MSMSPAIKRGLSLLSVVLVIGALAAFYLTARPSRVELDEHALTLSTSLGGSQRIELQTISSLTLDAAPPAGGDADGPKRRLVLARNTGPVIHVVDASGSEIYFNRESDAATRDLFVQATRNWQVEQRARQPQLDGASKAQLDALLGLIEQRLALAPGVAQAKYNTHAAIEDLPRERAVVDAVAAQAESFGLTRDQATAFMRAQIEASKILQQRQTQKWTGDHVASFPNAPDLAKEIRPALDRLTPELLRALAAARPALRHPAAPGYLYHQAADIGASWRGGTEAAQKAVTPLLDLAGER